MLLRDSKMAIHEPIYIFSLHYSLGFWWIERSRKGPRLNPSIVLQNKNRNKTCPWTRKWDWFKMGTKLYTIQGKRQSSSWSLLYTLKRKLTYHKLGTDSQQAECPILHRCIKFTWAKLLHLSLECTKHTKLHVLKATWLKPIYSVQFSIQKELGWEEKKTLQCASICRLSWYNPDTN